MPLVSLPSDDDASAAPVVNEALDKEALFAAIGLGPILAARPTLHKYQIRKAADLPKELRRRVLAFIASDAFKEAKDVPEFDYDATLETVANAQREGGAAHLDDKQSQALLAVAPDMADDFAVQANRILAWANPLMPRETRPAVIGTRPDQPDPTTMADFRRVWQVALDPMSVVDDLEDGSLSDEQVGALAILYPAYYGELRAAVTEEMAAMEGRRGKKWEPDPRKSALLSMVMQTQQSDPELAANVQQMYAQQPDAKPVTAAARRQRGGGAGSASDAATPGQKAAGGVSTAG